MKDFFNVMEKVEDEEKEEKVVKERAEPQTVEEHKENENEDFEEKGDEL